MMKQRPEENRLQVLEVSLHVVRTATEYLRREKQIEIRRKSYGSWASSYLAHASQRVKLQKDIFPKAALFHRSMTMVLT